MKKPTIYFVSFVTSESEPENEYQLHVKEYKKNENEDYVPLDETNADSLINILGKLFCSKLENFDYFDIPKYLNYHYEKYQYKKKVFLDYLRDYLSTKIQQLEYELYKIGIIPAFYNEQILILRKYQKALEIIENMEKDIESEEEEVLQETGIDLSYTKVTEKIIYLKELGVLDFLRGKQPFVSSINSLATVLSAITDENNTTLQPILNAMYSTDLYNKNNPYNTEKTVKKVRNHLIEVGFSIKVD